MHKTHFNLCSWQSGLRRPEQRDVNPESWRLFLERFSTFMLVLWLSMLANSSQLCTVRLQYHNLQFKRARRLQCLLPHLFRVYIFHVCRDVLFTLYIVYLCTNNYWKLEVGCSDLHHWFVCITEVIPHSSAQGLNPQPHSNLGLGVERPSQLTKKLSN